MPATARLRAACDICHELKVRCSGNLPCEGCSESGVACFYSITNRLGRPPGAKNKRKASPAANANEIPDRAAMKMPPQSHRAGSGGQNGKNASSGRGGCSLNIPPSLRRTPWPSPQQQLPSPHSSARNSGQTSSISSNISEASTAVTYRHDLLEFDDPKDTSWDANWNDLSVLRGGWNWSSTDDDLSLGSRETGNHVDMVSVDPMSSQTLAFDRFDTMHRSKSPENIHAGSETEKAGGMSHNQAGGNGSKPESIHGGDCLCLQRHTDLLCALKRPEPRSGSSTPDRGASAGPCLSRALLNIQNALQVWNGFIECPKCAHDDDQEVLLLTLMCMRAALFQLQKAGWGDFNTCSPSPAHLFPVLSLGDVEIKGDEKLMLLHALRSITLRKTESILMRLKETLERKKAALEKSFDPSDRNWEKSGRDPWAHSGCEDGASNLGHADQMMQGLVRFVKTLENG